jgi:hypothetical protein
MLTSAITQQMVILFIALNPKILLFDVVLIYRMRGTIDATTQFGNLFPELFYRKVS